PTEDQIQNSIELLQQPFWDFGNPSPPEDWNLGGPDYSAWVPDFYQFWSELGFDLPPLYDDPDVAPDTAATLAGAAGSGDAVSAMLAGIGPDFAAMFGSDFASEFGTDLAAVLGPDFTSELGFDVATALAP